MTKHQFIFSDQRNHRIARHVIFWLVWCIAFNILFHFPLHVFKGWDVSGPGTKNYQELGPVIFFIKALIVNSFLAVIVPQIAFIYILMYWLLPNYFYKKRNIFLSITITASVLIVIYFVAVGCKYSPVLYNLIMNIESKGTATFISMMWIVMIDQLNSLPIILGIALIIKLVKRWWLNQKHIEQLVKEKMNAELQLLKAQVHPHFLFNTLNNIYSFTLTNSELAPGMIKKLSGLLNYILNECNQTFVPLDKELRMIEDYMALEKIRYGEQMEMKISVTGNYVGKMISPLLLIPFVENSFKHGASRMITQPWIKLLIEVENNQLSFIITNSKPLSNEVSVAKGNIGLKNVKKRLELLYPKKHEFNIKSDAECYTVILSLELLNLKEHNPIKDEFKQMNEYALA